MTRDPASAFSVVLDHDGAGRLLLFDRSGAPAGTIDAPPGYRLSHLVEMPDRLLVVAEGEVPLDGWNDWHFAIDAAGARLERAGPAY